MIFFNCSLPRSGSELMQQVLHQHPDIYASRTDGFLELIYGARQNFSTLPEFVSQDQSKMTKAFQRFCFQGLQGWTDGLKGDKKHTCLKSRGITHWYEWFSAFMGGDPKVIVMVRDIRGIVASMEKLYLKNKHLVADVDDPAKMRGITLGQRVDEWFNQPPVGLALQRLKGAFERGIQSNLLFVTYEEFLGQPQETMNRVYEYLELDSFVHDFNNLPELDSEQDSMYGVFGNHQLKKALKPFKADYIEVLGKEMSSAIMKNNLWFYNQFYPEKV